MLNGGINALSDGSGNRAKPNANAEPFLTRRVVTEQVAYYLSHWPCAASSAFCAASSAASLSARACAIASLAASI